MVVIKRQYYQYHHHSLLQYFHQRWRPDFAVLRRAMHLKSRHFGCLLRLESLHLSDEQGLLQPSVVAPHSQPWMPMPTMTMTQKWEAREHRSGGGAV